MTKQVFLNSSLEGFFVTFKTRLYFSGNNFTIFHAPHPYKSPTIANAISPYTPTKNPNIKYELESEILNEFFPGYIPLKNIPKVIKYVTHAMKLKISLIQLYPSNPIFSLPSFLAFLRICSNSSLEY